MRETAKSRWKRGGKEGEKRTDKTTTFSSGEGVGFFSTQSEKTASWKRCKADSILCSGDIRLVRRQDLSSHFFTLSKLRSSIPFSLLSTLSTSFHSRQAGRRLLHPHEHRHFVYKVTTTTTTTTSLATTTTTTSGLLLRPCRIHPSLARLERFSFGAGYLPTSKMAA